MKDIYVVFVASDYKIGKFIRAVTGSRYNHMALSETPGLSVMYSFARKFNRTPLVGGYVEELPHRYTKKEKSDPQVRVCRVSLCESDYAEVQERLDRIKTRSDVMKYNFLSAAAYPFHRACPVRDAYTCVEFVQYVMGVEGFNTIEDFQRMFGNVVYEGGIRGTLSDSGKSDSYYSRRSFIVGAGRFVGDLAVVIGRKLSGQKP